MKKDKPLDSPVYKTIILRLIEARQEIGLSQVQVAKLLNKTQSSISKIEARKSYLDLLTFYDLAKIYKKEISKYFELI